MAMSLAAATSGAGTDSGVETGNDSNDLESDPINIHVNCIHHNFDSSDNEGILVVPPPGQEKSTSQCSSPIIAVPPTSPESAAENHDDSESEMTTTRDHFPIFPITVGNNSDIEPGTSNNASSDVESIDMERDDDDEDDELQEASALESPHLPGTTNAYADDNVEEDPFSTRDQRGSSVIYFQAYNPPYHEFTLPSFTPPPPPPTPTNMNTCKALMKFEFPELPKLMCQFVEPPAGGFEPPAGLQSFISLEQFDGKQSKGYNIVSSPAEDYGQRSSQCTALIPYEYEQHQLRNKSYSVWSKSRKLRRSSSGCIGMTGRAEYNERRLRTAANTNNIQMLTKILESGTDPNAADELGRSALHSAACRGHSEVVRLLLHYGANPNKKDSVGNTPLHLAACTNHFDVVTCLLRAGTDVSTLDNRGRNPLQLAQSKLKLIASAKQQPVTEDALKIKTEVQQIIEMMLEYLQKKGQDMEAEFLNAFANRLTLSQTPDQEFGALLAELSSLSLTSAATAAAANLNKNRNLTAPVSNSSQLGHLASSPSSSSSFSSSSFLQPSKLFSSNNSINMNTSSENIVKLDDDHSVGSETNNFSSSPPFSFFK